MPTIAPVPPPMRHRCWKANSERKGAILGGEPAISCTPGADRRFASAEGMVARLPPYRELREEVEHEDPRRLASRKRR